MATENSKLKNTKNNKNTKNDDYELHAHHARGDGAGDMFSEIRAASSTGGFQRLRPIMRTARGRWRMR